MKNTFKKSFVLFTLMAAFAMIFVGCSKDSSNGGVTPTVNNYGTITVGDQSYDIAAATYSAYFDEDLQSDVVTIAIVDRISDNPNVFSVTFPYKQSITTGTFTYTTGEPSPNGQCMGSFESNGNILTCISGSITISSDKSNYQIESEGVASAMLGQGGTQMDFAISFEGPITEDGGSPIPPTGEYGTIEFDNQTFTIAHSGYTVSYDEDLDANIVGIGLATADDEKGAAIAIPFYSTVPTGQFTITTSENPEQGDGGLAIVLNSNPAYIATQGTITINKNGNEYTIDASGPTLSLQGGDVKEFTLHFTGPLPFYED